MYTDGNMISGTWTNKVTGKTVQVRSSIMDGDNMVILTNDGMIDMMEFSRNYIQISEEVFDQNGNVIQNYQESFNNDTPMNAFNDRPKHTFNDDELSVLMGTRNVYGITEDTNINVITNNPKESEIRISTMPENFKYIDKVFNKLPYDINIKLEIDWNSIPKDKLAMLVDIFDISTDDIASYIYDKYFNKDIVIAEIQNKLNNLLI